MMKTDSEELRAIYEDVDAIHSSMAELASGSFLESELIDLRVLIRLTVEFAEDLQNPNTFVHGHEESEFVCQSIFSGIHSFSSVCSAYDILAGSRPTSVLPVVESIESLRERFLSLYREFRQKNDFEGRCRLLLDLFKLQIVFAGLSCG